jgi:S-methylmethionine-dependent homocysteine/selenocysteine methylase
MAEAVACAREIGAETLLFNCSQAEMMATAITAARQLDADLPLGAYANAFVPSKKEGAANEGLSDMRADLDPEAYARIASTWVDAGGSVIGGCCGIGCDHIAHLSQTLTTS